MPKFVLLFLCFAAMAQADFSLSATPSKFSLQKGSSVTVVATQTNPSFTGVLDYTLLVLDSQFSYTMTRVGNTATFVIAAAQNASAASTFFTIQASSGIFLHNFVLRATITDPPPAPALPAPTIGSIAISSVVTTNAQTVNLTTLGSGDWFSMGNYGSSQCSLGSCMSVRKNTGTGLLGVKSVGAGDPNLYTYSPNLTNVTWSDGTAQPNGTASYTLNTSIALQAFASTTQRTLSLIAGLSSGPGTLTVTAHLTDGTTADVSDTQTFTGAGMRVYTIPFKASSAGHQLQITLTRTNGALVLYGGALAGTISPETHYMLLTDDIQAFLLTASAGDTLQLPDGYAFVGHLILPTRLATGVVDIKGNIPAAAGTRIKPGETKVSLTSPDDSPVVQNDIANPDHTKRSARGYRFTGVEFTVNNPKTSVNWNLIYLGFGDNPIASDIPSDITFDRCYIHGDGVTNYLRGILGNANNLTVMNSYIGGFVSTFSETQAILSYSSNGPIQIINNYLEATGENVLIGGVGPDIGPSMTPVNGTIQHNYFAKPIAWRGSAFIVKNLLEFKNGYKFTVDSNVFENCWAANQAGFGAVVTPRTAQGGTIGNHVDNISFTNNLFEHMASGIVIAWYDDLAKDASGNPVPISQLQLVHDITLANNLFDDLGLKYSYYSWGLEIVGPPNNLVITHNTWNFGETSDWGWWLVETPRISSSNAVITNNDFGNDLGGDGIGGSDAVLPGSTFTGNNIRNARSNWYSSPYAAKNTFNQPSAAGAGADVNGLRAIEPAIRSGNR